MIDRASVGRRGARFRFVVEEGKIRELARATFSTQDAFLGDQPVVPPTFLKLSQFAWELPGRSALDLVGFDPANPPLHAEQEFTYAGPPPRAGDELSGQTVVESIAVRPSRTYGALTYVVIATEYDDPSGRRVAVARSTSVVRPAPGTEPPTPDPVRAPVPPTGQSRPQDDAGAPTLGPDAARQVDEPPPPSSTAPLTLTDLVRYQGAGGDMNPSHHDADFARRTGAAGVFAPGLLSAALMADWATAWLGAGRVRRFGVRFQSQVFLGDVLTCAGRATATGESDEGPTVELSLECRRQDGTVTTAGWATFLAR